LDTQATRRRLATAYQDAGRTAEAIPLLERASADRKPILRSDHPATQAAPKDLAAAESLADQVADASTPPEQIPVARKAQPADTAAGRAPAAACRRPPGPRAGGPLSAGPRPPPAAPARQPFPGGVPRPPVKLTDRSSTPGRHAKKAPRKDSEYDH